tara:strand:- start:401 stop:1453 length:1053 start_codon:yes stop_codon:yes gene_type:complete
MLARMERLARLRRNIMHPSRLCLVLYLAAVCAFLAASILASPTFAQAPDSVTRETLETWMTELSNWGRWGNEDQLGTLNLITPQKRKEAAALVLDGESISLAHDPLKTRAVDNPAPFEHRMLEIGMNNPGQFVLDSYSVRYHGYAHTHLDALCHMSAEGEMYNGFPQDTVTEGGCQKLGIDGFKQGIFTRGILIDIPRLKGVEYLEPGTQIHATDLEAWEKRVSIQVESGDAVFIRTGRWARRRSEGPWAVSRTSAGLHASVARWLKERDVAVLGSDAASDVFPSGVEGSTHPVHQLALVAMGMPIFDNADLETLSETAARLNRWEFLLTAAPIPVGGGTGSPLNPIATF